MPAANPALAIRNAEWVRLHVLEGLTYDQIAQSAGALRETVAKAIQLPASQRLKAKYLAQLEDDILAQATHNLREGIAEKCRLRQKIAHKLEIHKDGAIEGPLPDGYTWDARTFLETDKQLDNQLHRIKGHKLAVAADLRAQEVHDLNVQKLELEVERLRAELEALRKAGGENYEPPTFPAVVVSQLPAPERAREAVEDDDEDAGTDPEPPVMPES